jgi:predicted GTPase
MNSINIASITLDIDIVNTISNSIYSIDFETFIELSFIIKHYSEHFSRDGIKTLHTFYSDKMRSLIILQNKVDLITKKKAEKHYFEIIKFIEKTDFEYNPIIPISAQRKCNIDVLIQTIVEYVPDPQRDLSLNLKMYLKFIEIY